MKSIKHNSIVSFLLTGFLLTPLTAYSDDDSRIGFSLSTRSLAPSFSEYQPGTTYYMDESFSFLGLGAEYLNHIRKTNTIDWFLGVGLSLYTGSWESTASGPTNYEGDSATAVEPTVFTEMDYPLQDRLHILLRAGVNYLLVYADTGTPASGPYAEAWDEGYPDLFGGVGVDYVLDNNHNIAGLFRFTLADLGAWTDTNVAGGTPEINDYSVTGFQFQYSF